MLDKQVSFTNNELHKPIISLYEIPYEKKQPALTEEEYNKYQYAKVLFQIRQFDGVANVLGDSKKGKLYFLRLYAKYLAGEKRKEELTQEVLGVSEDTKAENTEIVSIYKELAEDHKKGELDAFGLYLYGVVLRKRSSGFMATAVLLESLRLYEYNWSAWMELAALVQDFKKFTDLQVLLNHKFEGSIMKNFFLAKLCIDLQHPAEFFKVTIEPLTSFFPNSSYITSQWAVLFYNTMDYNESMMFFELLRQTHPARLDDLDIYSNLLFIQNMKDKLCILAQECEKIDKYRPETCCVKANYYSMKKEISESVKFFKRALKLNRSYHLAWTLLGHEYIELKNTSAAIECYRRAVGVYCRDYRAWYGLGQAYEVMKFPYDALFHYHKATDLRPHDGRMWLALANCYSTLQRDVEQRDCERKSRSCDHQGKTSAVIQVGKVYESMGRMNAAIEYYHKVWSETPRSEHMHVSNELAEISLKLAAYAYKKNDVSNAEQYAATALNAKHPYHEMARNLLDKIEGSQLLHNKRS
ncbi:unnamed protein product [Mucor hiemalis]